MQQSAQVQRIGVSQIILLNSFFNMKLEILDILIGSDAQKIIDNIRQNFNIVDDSLRTILSNLVEIRNNNNAYAKLKQKGMNVHFLNAKTNMELVNEGINDLSEWFTLNEKFYAEGSLIAREINSLEEIMASTQDLIGNKSVK